MVTAIENVLIRKILDSRGKPTVEVEVFSQEGQGRAQAPSGASTGIHEVLAFPEHGVDYAISNFRENIGPKLLGMDVLKQDEIDGMLTELDGTPNFSNIGGNVAVACSLAVAKAAASSSRLPLYRYLGGSQVGSLPYPLGNVLGGGKHAIGGTDIQEYLAISLGPSAKDSIFANSMVHEAVKAKLKKKFPNRALGKGDEGAWVAAMDNEEALEVVDDVCKDVSSEVGFKVRPSLDLAASELYRGGYYHYKNGKLTPDEQIEFILHLIENYSLYSVEDPLDQEDFEGYAQLTEACRDRCIIVGDDLFVTNPQRVKKGIDMKSASAVLIKPNQIGTLTQTVRTIKLAHENGLKTVVSHRSGETNDCTISHLAVAFGCHALKCGVVGGERIAKLNEIIRIEEEITQLEG